MGETSQTDAKRVKGRESKRRLEVSSRALAFAATPA